MSLRTEGRERNVCEQVPANVCVFEQGEGEENLIIPVIKAIIRKKKRL